MPKIPAAIRKVGLKPSEVPKAWAVFYLGVQEAIRAREGATNPARLPGKNRRIKSCGALRAKPIRKLATARLSMALTPVDFRP